MNDVIEIISGAEKISIIAHEDEDADAVGSCFAMKLALLQLGKSVKCYFSAPTEKHIQFMGSDYTVFDENTETEQDLCICLDCGDIKRLGRRVKIFEAAEHTLSIDHHETNTRFADVNYVDAKASATAEILYRLFAEMKIDISREIAENLYAAISADTGSFKYSNVTEQTMLIASKLIGKNIDHAKIARLLHDTDPIGVIKCKAEIMQNIEAYFDGRLTIVTATDAIFEKYGISERDSGDIVNLARAVSGCAVAVSIRETGDKIKISFRSNGEISVSQIAQDFGGGGHAMAAGAKLYGKTVLQAKAEVISAFEEFFK